MFLRKEVLTLFLCRKFKEKEQKEENLWEKIINYLYPYLIGEILRKILFWARLHTVGSNPGMDACTGLYDIYHGGK